MEGSPAAAWLLPLAWLVAGALAALVGGRWVASRTAARLRRDFAAGMSHDLRTPLAQIQLFTEMLLLGRDRTPGERAEWLQVIEREAHSLGSLVDNLLLLADAPGAGAFPARERLDLGELAEDVAAAFAPRAAARGMTIVADPPAGVHVRADPRALRQTVANLLENALRFGPPGQVVVLTVRAGEGAAELAVEDQGPGLRGEDRARFLRPSGHRVLPLRSCGGRGLGLAVVAEVVRAHGGGCEVEDGPGCGARVSIVLPLANAEAVPALRA